MKSVLARLGLVALPLLAMASSACRGTRSTPSEVAPPPSSEAAVAPAQATPVTSTEAKRLVNEGAALLDVRTPEEFAAGHVEGATNFPLQRLEAGEARVHPRLRPRRDAGAVLTG